MIFKYFKLILPIVIGTQLTSCSTNFIELIEEKQNKSESVNFIDNREIKKIVTLTSLSTDIVAKISPEKLVAIPGSSLFKDTVEFNDLPRISMGRTPPNIEKIISLEPDLVIGVKGFHEKIINRLNDLNIKTISYDVRSWDDLESLIIIINNEINDQELLIKDDFISINLKDCNKNKISEKNKKTNIVVLASTKPMLSPNSNSWAGQLLSRFNLNSLTKDIDSKSEFKGYINLSPEWLLKQDPQNLIIIETREGQFTNFSSTEPFSNLSAVKSNKVYKLNYYGLINPGSLTSINNACKKLKQIY